MACRTQIGLLRLRYAKEVSRTGSYWPCRPSPNPAGGNRPYLLLAGSAVKPEGLGRYRFDVAAIAQPMASAVRLTSWTRMI